MMHEKTNKDRIIELHDIARSLESQTEYHKQIAGILRQAADELSALDKSMWMSSFVTKEEMVKLDLNHFKLIKAYVDLKKAQH